MAIESGFFNGADREYDAQDFSAMFDGVIIDGVFASVGTAFVAKIDTGNKLNIGVGYAWFHSTYLRNTSVLELELPVSDIVLPRIDAIVMEFNNGEGVRTNDIKIIEGVPNASPQKPELIKTTDVNQYPICYVTRPANSTTITADQVENRIGTVDTPFVLGILETIDLDTLLGQWEGQLNTFISNMSSEYTAWWDEMKANLTSEKALFDQWMLDSQAAYEYWFNNIKENFSEDVAARLQAEIDARVKYEDIVDDLNTVDPTKVPSLELVRDLSDRIDTAGKKLLATLTTSQNWRVPEGISKIDVFIVGGGYDGAAVWGEGPISRGAFYTDVSVTPMQYLYFTAGVNSASIPGQSTLGSICRSPVNISKTGFFEMAVMNPYNGLIAGVTATKNIQNRFDNNYIYTSFRSPPVGVIVGTDGANGGNGGAGQSFSSAYGSFQEITLGGNGGDAGAGRNGGKGGNGYHGGDGGNGGTTRYGAEIGTGGDGGNALGLLGIGGYGAQSGYRGYGTDGKGGAGGPGGPGGSCNTTGANQRGVGLGGKGFVQIYG